MSEYVVELGWSLDDGEMAPGQYVTNHGVDFDPDSHLIVSAAPDFGGDARCANPEQMLAAALSSCHMLTFLSLAAKMKWPVEGYSDRAVAVLGKRTDGRMTVASITLNPEVRFSADAGVDAEKLEKTHERAHRYCFVGNALDLEVTINPTSIVSPA